MEFAAPKLVFAIVSGDGPSSFEWASLRPPSDDSFWELADESLPSKLDCFIC